MGWQTKARTSTFVARVFQKGFSTPKGVLDLACFVQMSFFFLCPSFLCWVHLRHEGVAPHPQSQQLGMILGPKPTHCGYFTNRQHFNSFLQILLSFINICLCSPSIFFKCLHVFYFVFFICFSNDEIWILCSPVHQRNCFLRPFCEHTKWMSGQGRVMHSGTELNQGSAHLSGMSNSFASHQRRSSQPRREATNIRNVCTRAALSRRGYLHAVMFTVQRSTRKG